MKPEIVRKIMDVQEAALGDAEYAALLEEHEMRNRRFLEALGEMSGEHRDAVMDYVGLFAVMHLRLLEISCARCEKS